MDDEPPVDGAARSGGSAADDPQTRDALGAHQAGALRWLGGGVIAVVLGVLLGVGTVAVVSDTGQRVPIVGSAVVVLVLTGTVAAFAGVGALVRNRRWRAALRRVGWQHGRLRIAGPAIISFEPDGYDELDPGDRPVALRLLSTAIWRTRAVQQLHGAAVRAAPVSGREWVITADGAGTVYGARTTRRRG